MNEMKVRLRPLLRKDSELLYEWITDRNLRVLNAAYVPVSQIEHEVWVDATLKGREGAVFFVIEELDANRAIGTCQLLSISSVHRSAELQIRIGDVSAQSRGLGSDAVRQLIRFGFDDLNLHRIFLQVFLTNERAIGAYEKCGFAREGILRQAAYIDGKFVDVLCMALLKEKDE